MSRVHDIRENTAKQSDEPQNFASSVERLEEIENAIRPILDTEKLWITPTEFLASVEAHRRAHDNKIKAEPYDHSKCGVVVYELKRPVICNRQREFNGLEVA